ncbi:MAG: hypothetical protein R2690_06785 [Acidimicrobiales bacterium]
MNLLGSIHVEPWYSRPDGGWADMIDIGVKATARPPPRPPSASTPGPRTTYDPPRSPTGLLPASISSAGPRRRGRLLGRPLRLPTTPPGYGGGVRDPCSNRFRPPTERLRIARPDDLSTSPPTGSRFITRREQPVLAFETAGTVWTLAGETVDLMAAYNQAGRNLATVVDRLTASALEA